MRTANQVAESRTSTPRAETANAALIAARESLNLRVSDVANAIRYPGQTPSSISAKILEAENTGKLPDLRTAMILARFYETDTESLFGALVENPPDEIVDESVTPLDRPAGKRGRPSKAELAARETAAASVAAGK